MRQLIHDRLPHVEIMWTTIDPDKGVRLALDKIMQPDLVLVDMTMETFSGEEICRRIRHRNAVVQLLGMVASAKGLHGAELARSGAQGIISKNSTADFIDGIVEVLRGGVYGDYGFLDAHDSYEQLKGAKPVHSDEVSTRQAQVMNLMSTGMTDPHIADEIGIAEGTVRKHAQLAMAKLHAETRVQAVLAWTELQAGRTLQPRYITLDGNASERPRDRPSHECSDAPHEDDGDDGILHRREA